MTLDTYVYHLRLALRIALSELDKIGARSTAARRAAETIRAGLSEIGIAVGEDRL